MINHRERSWLLSWLKKFLLILLWWVFWSSIYSQFFTIPAQASAAESILIRAVFPNPVGSDTQEWILLENTSNASISGSLLKLSDVYGSTKEYSVPGFLLPYELRFIPATQSALVLNNDTDAVVLKYGGTVVQQTEAYANLAEDVVWWQRSDGEWQAETRTAFLLRLPTYDWQAKNLQEVTRENSEKLETLAGQTLLERQITEAVLRENSQNLLKNTEEKKNLYNLAENENIENSLIYRYNFKMPNVWQSNGEIAKKREVDMLKIPEYDYVSEENQFTLWKRQALGGALLFSCGGFFLCLSIIPQVWQWYRVWAMRW